ncbi:MAG: alpha-L-fucosidase, partial [bacterium]|nr:alpha-L-fucosidase [bacterium]
WAQLAVDSGAKFFTVISEFHDGFAMYDSSHTRFNSVAMGPKRDITGELAREIRAKGLKFGVSNHFAWNCEFFRYKHRNKIVEKGKDLKDLYGDGGGANEWHIDRWWRRTTELCDKYKPDLYYFDWGWNRKGFSARKRLEFAAYLYNKGIEWGRGKPGGPGVVLNYKHSAIPAGCGVLDLERGQLRDIRPMTWQNDTSISKKSWGYSTTDKYKTADEIVDMLMDIVSKNGVLMLAFGPRADGTVPSEYKKPLLDIGRWLKVCGQAVYATRPYVIYGEGVTVPRRGMHGDENTYKASDIRFTRNKANTVLYATVLDWPGKTLLIKSLGKDVFDTKNLKSVQMLGVSENLKWQQDQTGLKVTMPDRPKYGYAYPIKLEFTGTVPSCKPKKK